MFIYSMHIELHQSAIMFISDWKPWIPTFLTQTSHPNTLTHQAHPNDMCLPAGQRGLPHQNKLLGTSMRKVTKTWRRPSGLKMPQIQMSLTSSLCGFNVVADEWREIGIIKNKPWH